MVETATEDPYRHISRGGRSVDPMAKGFFGYGASETWRPNVNLYETDSAYLVCVDLAGVDKQQIDVLIEGQSLRIRGMRQAPSPEGLSEAQCRKVRIHLMEIDHGTFSRDVELPADVRRDKIVANHRNGMLWIELPKRQS